MGFSVGGMAAAINGFQQGQDDAVARQARKDDLAFQTTQRARQQDEWKRDDELRTSNAGIPKTKTFTTPADASLPALDDEGTPSAAALPVSKQVATTEDEQMRQMAQNYLKAGKTDQYLALSNKADEIGWKRSADMFSQLQASAPTMGTEQLAHAVANTFSNDPFAGKATVRSINGDGTVTMDIANRDTGQTITHTFKDKQEMLGSLQAYYSPKMFQALQQKRIEELSKLHVIPAGGALAQGGQIVAKNDNGYMQVGTNADGSPILQKTGAGGALGGAGGAGKNGKTPQTVYDEAGKILDTTLKGTPENIASAHALKDQLLQDYPNMSAGQVAKVATQALLNPQSVQPKFDVKTGSFVDAVNDGTQSFVLSGSRPDIKTVSQRLGGDDKARALVQQSLAQVPAPVLAEVQAGAADPAKAKATAERIAAQGGNPQAFLNLVSAVQFANKKTGFSGLVDSVKGAVTGNQPAAAPVQQAVAPNAVAPAAPAATAAPAPAVVPIAGAGRTNLAADRRRTAEEAVAKQRAEEQSRQQFLQTQAPHRARQMLAEWQAGNPQQRMTLKRDLYQLMATDAFGALDKPTQLQISTIVNSPT